MRVTVVIPNYNGERLLGPCLDSLAAQTRPAERVVVVDNGSSDRSLDLVRAHPLRPESIALGANRGFAAAANAGIRAADGEVIVLLNNDAVADPRWLAAGLDALARHPAAGFVASLVLDLADRDRVDSAGDLYPPDGRPRPRGRGERAADFTAPMEAISAGAAAAFYRRELLERTGGFEESFFAYLEDVDLGLRARALGYRCRFEPAAVVYHQGAGTTLADRPGRRPMDSSTRVFLIASNRVRLLARTWPRRQLLRRLPALALGLGRGAAYHLLRSGQAGPFFAGLRAGLARLPEDRRVQAALFSPRAFAALLPLMLEGARPWRD
jgi:hypothetical protein